MNWRTWYIWWLGTAIAAGWAATSVRAGTIDFNRDIRPILSNNCLYCHGPDEKERKAGLRLDTFEGATAGGEAAAVVPGKPEASELLRRVTATDKSEMMPPPRTGKKLSPREIDLLRRWIAEGGKYAPHWAYVPPTRPAVPRFPDANAPIRNPIDAFLLARLQKEGLSFQPEADRYTLARRVALDLTGLPPSVAEVDAFVADPAPDAYEKFVERQLQKPSFGEHWARLWLDLARYADSAGYADDPPRTIWAYRDYVIQSFNANKPFDRFTIEQLAGDLLPNPTNEQLIATAFHRNTLTNNEGGTSDEEFRNVAVVDRVNTTMTVWMGTSMACAQCHSHKYDPISQKEYFQFFAFLNQTADADRTDESPLLSFYTPDQQRQRDAWIAERTAIEAKWQSPTPAMLASLAQWETDLPLRPTWKVLPPRRFASQANLAGVIRDDASIFVEKPAKTDLYTVELSLTDLRKLTALRLETLPDAKLPAGGAGHGGGNFVLTGISAKIVPPMTQPAVGRFVRIELPGDNQHLMLAEVQVFSGSENVALKGEAKQSSTAYNGPAHLAIDGKTDGEYFRSNSVTHTAQQKDPWWEVDLKSPRPIDRIVIWNRTDGGIGTRLQAAKVLLLDDQRQPVWQTTLATPPNPSVDLDLHGARPVVFTAAFADYAQDQFPAAAVLDGRPNTGWAVAGATTQPHVLTLLTNSAGDLPPGAKLVVTIEQKSPHANHTLGRFRFQATAEPRIGETARLPADILAALGKPAAQRTAKESAQIRDYYLRHLAPETRADRERLAALEQLLNSQKPVTVPIFRELPSNQRRTTRIQIRGNFLDLGETVSEGVPAVFHPLPSDAPKNRLGLARWLVDEKNPLTARVTVNRFWEQIFGTGLVRTSEEFGSQGELPTHPELLDWLAVEFMQSQWNVKQLLKLLVTSAAYRQSSKVTPQLLEKDPDNLLLSRGPRVRHSAEMVRDQALAVSGLLSPKIGGPSVKPPQPSLGLSAAFGRSIDWQPSAGPDKFRRGIYTEWRRTNPYPSMATFDAPNRDVCTVRRARTNTPLQALVTLNDPVYIEAAQALARRTLTAGTTPTEKVTFAFRQCLIRPPHSAEVARLLQLYEQAKADYTAKADQAVKLATVPIGPLPPNSDAAELAAWTVVANVLLNLDEMVLKR